MECLESLGRLDYPDWWVVLVDNGCGDDSVEKIRAWAKGEVGVERPYVRESGWPKPVPMVECDRGPPAPEGAGRAAFVSCFKRRIGGRALEPEAGACGVAVIYDAGLEMNRVAAP